MTVRCEKCKLPIRDEGYKDHVKDCAGAPEAKKVARRSRSTK